MIGARALMRALTWRPGGEERPLAASERALLPAALACTIDLGRVRIVDAYHSPIAAMLLQLAVSRQREFLADQTAAAETRIRAYTVVDPSVTEGLLEVAKYDPHFEPNAFVNGASIAYEMIVSEFADGNRKALKDLLSREVYDGFVAAIGEREARGEVVDQQFVGIKKAEILEAEMKGGVAFMTVRFVSELINATRNRAGDVIAGDPQKIKDVTDIWTFSRDVSNPRALSNPNWRLVATQAPN